MKLLQYFLEDMKPENTFKSGTKHEFCGNMQKSGKIPNLIPNLESEWDSRNSELPVLSQIN